MDAKPLTSECVNFLGGIDAINSNLIKAVMSSFEKDPDQKEYVVNIVNKIRKSNKINQDDIQSLCFPLRIPVDQACLGDSGESVFSNLSKDDIDRWYKKFCDAGCASYPPPNEERALFFVRISMILTALNALGRNLNES